MAHTTAPAASDGPFDLGHHYGEAHWTGGPTPILDDLAVFGPSPLDIVE